MVHTEGTRLNTLSTQESKNSRAAWRAEPKEHSSMNCENICVCSSWEYSLWLERSRDLRKPGGSGWVTKGLPQFSICHSPLPLYLYPALSSRHSGSMALKVTLLPQTSSALQHHSCPSIDLYLTAAPHQDHYVHLTPRAPRQQDTFTCMPLSSKTRGGEEHSVSALPVSQSGSLSAFLSEPSP